MAYADRTIRQAGTKGFKGDRAFRRRALDEETLLNRALLKLADRIVVESGGEFHPVRLRNIVNTMGGRDAARFLINNPPSEGFLRLRAIDRIDLTVEALILDNPDFWPLFSEEELAVCRLRMEKF